MSSGDGARFPPVVKMIKMTHVKLHIIHNHYNYLPQEAYPNENKINFEKQCF